MLCFSLVLGRAGPRFGLFSGVATGTSFGSDGRNELEPACHNFFNSVPNGIPIGIVKGFARSLFLLSARLLANWYKYSIAPIFTSLTLYFGLVCLERCGSAPRLGEELADTSPMDRLVPPHPWAPVGFETRCDQRTSPPRDG